MKKLIAGFLFFLFLSPVNATDTFELQVSIKNLKAPARLILTVRDIGQWTEYTAESASGYFEIKGSQKELAFAFLVLKYQSALDKAPEMDNVVELFLENRLIKMVGDGSLKSTSVIAGPFQSELEKLKQLVSALQPGQSTERMKVAKEFVENHPQSFVSIYVLQDFNLDGSFRMEVDKVAPLFELLSPRLKESAYGQELRSDILLAQRTAIGSVAPDFEQTDTLQRRVSLKSFSGKYLLIDFWASWCKPCRAENPELVRVFQLFRDKNFTVLGISLDNNRTSWLKAIRKDGLVWTQTSDLRFWKNEVALLYGVKTIPQNFLLDPEGRIIGRNIPPKDLAEWLSQHLK
jgi:peroxiredoxin